MPDENFAYFLYAYGTATSMSMTTGRAFAAEGRMTPLLVPLMTLV